MAAHAPPLLAVYQALCCLPPDVFAPLARLILYAADQRRPMPRVDRSGVRRSWANVARNKSPLEGNGFLSEEKTSGLTLTEQIAYHEGEAQRLRQQQRQSLCTMIALVVGPGVAFSAKDLWQHQVVSPELVSALTNAGIHNPRQLGKRLKALGLERVSADRYGAIWAL